MAHFHTETTGATITNQEKRVNEKREGGEWEKILKKNLTVPLSHTHTNYPPEGDVHTCKI
jgi:hypothetical protein